MNTKPESINIFTWCIHSPFPLNRCRIRIRIRSTLNVHIVLKCLFSECLFCIDFAIYNYISSRFAYDAFKPFIYYCIRQIKKHQSAKVLYREEGGGAQGATRESYEVATSKMQMNMWLYGFWWKWAATACALLRADYWLCRYFAMPFVDVPLSLRSRVINCSIRLLSS